MKKWIMIIVKAILLIVVLLVVWQLIYSITTTKEEVFILPQNFKGIVIIAYDQKDGSENVIEDGKFIYRIPPNGILKLKCKEVTTLSTSWYYFEDKQGIRTILDYCIPPCEEMKSNPNKLFAYGKSNGGVENEGEQIEFTSFLVGTSNDTDSLNRADEKLNIFELLKKSN